MSSSKNFSSSPPTDTRAKYLREKKSSDKFLKYLTALILGAISFALMYILNNEFVNIAFGAIGATLIYIFFLYIRYGVLPFFFPSPKYEPAIPFGKFDPKMFQPQKWGVSEKKFFEVFKSKEDYEKFVKTIDSRLERVVETFEGRVIKFDPDEINTLIGKILDIIEREGSFLSGFEIEDREHMRVALGIAIFHAILFHFGHTPSGVLSIFLKDKVVKKVLNEYTKGKTLQPANEVFKKAGEYLTYLHLTKLKPTDFPEDAEIFGQDIELSVLEFIKRKFKTLPEK